MSVIYQQQWLFSILVWFMNLAGDWEKNLRMRKGIYTNPHPADSAK
jgi:hypothetical protein